MFVSHLVFLPCFALYNKRLLVSACGCIKFSPPLIKKNMERENEEIMMGVHSHIFVACFFFLYILINLFGMPVVLNISVEPDDKKERKEEERKSGLFISSLFASLPVH